MAKPTAVSRERIVEAAYRMFLDEGADSLNARAVARASSCSTQPIFSHFGSMEKLRALIYERVDAHIQEILFEGETPASDSLMVCRRLIQFAGQYRRIFRDMFINGPYAREGFPLSGPLLEHICTLEAASGGLDPENTVRTCIFAFGLATVAMIDQQDNTERMLRELEAVRAKCRAYGEFGT